MDKTDKKGKSSTQEPVMARFRDSLQNAGMDDESTGFLLGRMARMVTEAIAAETEKLFGEDGLKKLSQEEDTRRRLEMVDQKFLEKKQMSLFEYRNKVAEEIVSDFEAQK